METNLAVLEKQAINAALNNEWEKALQLNTQLLKKRPNDINAIIRLGKSQIQTKNFKEAIKTFKKALEIDPINTIAKKNLKIAQEGKIADNALHTKKLIKEPGTTTELQLPTKKSHNITAGETLDLNIKKKSVDVLHNKKVINTIEEKDIVKSLNEAKDNKADIEASFIKEKNNKMTIVIFSSVSVFKSEKQDVKPYFKKGTIEEEEPELELGTDDQED